MNGKVAYNTIITIVCGDSGFVLIFINSSLYSFEIGTIKWV